MIDADVPRPGRSLGALALSLDSPCVCHVSAMYLLCICYLCAGGAYGYGVFAKKRATHSIPELISSTWGEHACLHTQFSSWTRTNIGEKTKWINCLVRLT